MFYILQERESQLKEQQEHEKQKQFNQLSQQQPPPPPQHKLEQQSHSQTYRQQSNEVRNQTLDIKLQNSTAKAFPPHEPTPSHNVLQERDNAHVPVRNRQHTGPPPPPPVSTLIT